MPGTRLSQDEKALLKKWKDSLGKASDTPYLTKISVKPSDDAVPLRGISDIDFEINYPVSVIVGANGAGKSTLLALCALAFSGNDYTPPQRSRAGYTFVDFFARTRWEAAPNNLDICWSFSSDSDRTIHRRTIKKWMHYESRESRPVHFIGTGRLTDPVENMAHRRAFSSQQEYDTKLESNEIADAMSRILGRHYSHVEELSSGRLNLSAVQTEDKYSSFNMGTGEIALLQILSGVFKAPPGSLVLVEEIELGIHASALRNLGSILVGAAKKRNLQIVVTSHSEWFVDSLPRQARTLIDRIGDKHIALPSVTTRTAMSTLSKVDRPELLIFGEDSLAVSMLSRALTRQHRGRVKMVAIGSDAQLLNAARFQALSAPQVPILVYWDGDVADADVRSWFNSSQLQKDGCHNLVEWQRSHTIKGDDGKLLPPEKVIKECILSSPEALSGIAKNVNVSAEEIKDILSSAIVVTDHHGFFKEISDELSLPEDSVREIVLGAYVEINEWSGLNDQIARMFRGDVRAFSTPGEAKSDEEKGK